MSKSSIAKKLLKYYRIARKQGYSTRISVAHAHFRISCGKRGAADLLGQTKSIHYNKVYWNKAIYS